MPDELLMTGDAARICGVVPDTIRLWNRKGKLLEAHRTERGVRLYRRSDVEAVAKERARRSSDGSTA
jgi:DNA-binding transcriptional MerR regulator